MNKTKMYLLSLFLLSISQYLNAQSVPVLSHIVKMETYTPSFTFTAKFESQEHALLTPQVSGYLIKQVHPDGAFVEQGDVLFKIDPAPYQQMVNIAEARLAQARAAQNQAELTYSRFDELLKSGGISRASYDDASAELALAKAEVAVAKASLENAYEDLSYTEIRAPYSGQIGKSQYSIGDMVAPSMGYIIDITEQETLNALFSMNYKQFVDLGMNSEAKPQISLEHNGQLGHLTFIDNKINQSSGTIHLSAVFDNSEYAYKPNQITRIKVTQAEAINGAWLPQTAVIQDLLTRYIYIVDSQQRAERRNVTIHTQDNNMVFVTSGIDDGEQVIIDGLIRVRPQRSVQVQ
ncbi:efflux RND transporter periplasmic adaptor subunit [Photobacterium sp. BZF1]|uniref:efflux RND transporter periplasmic adaptor subunit n=1 Tax=Photobacterium sp. BZF1 TaxID=1904457 RepID=UPI0016539C58|nr:efflux RND transporter periplasmic adaptor subunit [Photobacterium sp. BZF1]MBC7006098.1 efflux RND transporter periplasmic adaptor subunit [Photobacterium sp. BZF1]